MAPLLTVVADKWQHTLTQPITRICREKVTILFLSDSTMNSGAKMLLFQCKSPRPIG